MRRKLTISDLVRMNVPQEYWSASVSKVLDNTSFGKKVPVSAVDFCIGFLREIDSRVLDGLGIIMSGSNGTGKTSIAVLILKEARRRGHSGLFVMLSDLVTRSWSDRFDGDVTWTQRAKEVDVLVVDEFGHEHDQKSKYNASLIHQIIKFRCASRKLTIMTTNMVAGDIRARYPVSMIEAMKDKIVFMPVSGPNWRNTSKNAAERTILSGLT